MYSLVLMAALGSGGEMTASQPEQPRPAIQLAHSHELNRHRRRGGCHGGCSGGGCWGGSYSCCGCWGGGYSCSGGYGCTGGPPYGVMPYRPATMPAPARRSGYYGEFGGYGEYAPGKMPMPGAEGYRGEDRNRPAPAPAPDQRQDRSQPNRQNTPSGTDRPGSTNPPTGTDQDRPRQETSTAAPATIVVSLPADAKLTVDDSPTRSTTSRRVFISPPLEPGKKFHYTLKAEVMRNGKPVTETLQIDVRAGQLTQVDMNLPSERVARR